MRDFVFISGNPHKVRYLEKWLGRTVEHHKVDLDEIQSLDLHTVVAHKARQAYAIVHRPVLVEDVSLTFEAMGRLPGPLIKWFLQELKPEGLCKLATGLDHRKAVARVLYGLYDGEALRTFEGRIAGTIAPIPRFSEASGWLDMTTSWNSIFIPDGSNKTYGEMTDEELAPFSHRARAVEKLKAYCNQA